MDFNQYFHKRMDELHQDYARADREGHINRMAEAMDKMNELALALYNTHSINHEAYNDYRWMIGPIQ